MTYLVIVAGEYAATLVRPDATECSDKVFAEDRLQLSKFGRCVGIDFATQQDFF